MAALGLSACGRKGPLDPPPMAGAAAPVTADGVPGTASESKFGRAQKQTASRPTQPKNEPFILDWLVD